MALPLNQLSYAEIVIKGLQTAAGSNSRPCFNVFCYKRSNLALTMTEAHVWAAFWTLVGVPLLAAANIRYTPSLGNVRFIDDPTRMGIDITQAGTGAIATDSQPQQNTVVSVLRTNYRGSAGRGKKCFGGVSEADTTGDVLTGGGLTRWQAVNTALAANFTDADGNVWTPQILSRKWSNLQQTPAALIWANPVVSATLDTNISNLRRRKANVTH